MSERVRTDAGLALGWTALVGGILVATFWILYFTKAVELGQSDGLLSSFESAFPIADAVFCLILFAASFTLLKRTALGPFFLVIGASMSLYLGILDATFYARQGLYNPLTTSGALSLTISAVCVVGGAIGLWFGWTMWTER